MAVVHYSGSDRSAPGKSQAVAPIEVQMLETSGLLGIFCLIHLVAGLALWTSMLAASLLWVALNARSLQESDATLAQRFFGLRIDTPHELTLSAVVAYSFTMSGLGCVAWMVDIVVSTATNTTITRRITGCEIGEAVDPVGFH